MKFRDLGGHRLLLVFDTGDEIAGELKSFFEQQGIKLASFTAIGALSSVELMAFDPEDKSYKTSFKLDEQCELASLVGNVARHDNHPLVHAHLTVGKRDGAAFAGHLKSAVVRPTCEMFVQIDPPVAEKHRDPRWELPLYQL